MKGRLVATLSLAIVVACGGDASDGKYKQTWTKAYSETTCTDWNGSAMDQHQRYVMAADFLLTLQRKDKPAAEIPADSLIALFQGGITQLCQADVGFTNDEKKISPLASLIYSQDRPTYGP